MSGSEPLSQSFLDLANRFKAVNLSDLHPAPQNARKHSNAQLRKLTKSLQAFGFIAPILADKNGNILAGHARFEAAKILGMTKVLVLFVHHLTEAQAKAYHYSCIFE